MAAIVELLGHQYAALVARVLVTAGRRRRCHGRHAPRLVRRRRDDACRLRLVTAALGTQVTTCGHLLATLLHAHVTCVLFVVRMTAESAGVTTSQAKGAWMHAAAIRSEGEVGRLAHGQVVGVVFTAR